MSDSNWEVYVSSESLIRFSTHMGIEVRLFEVWCRGKRVFASPSKQMCVDYAQRWKPHGYVVVK
jgi:hypothetical protein